MRKILREIRRIAPEATVTISRRNHYKVYLPNGAMVVVSSTPSRQSYLDILRADVRRQSKKPNTRINP
jgi:hypothetical protein